MKIVYITDRPHPTPSSPNQLWVSDITYWKWDSYFLYISLITDAYSPMIVGYHIATPLQSIETIQALTMAILHFLICLKTLFIIRIEGVNTAVEFMSNYLILLA